jgi:hypothetical protein
VVKLSEEARERLNTVIHAGKHPARQLTRARILLNNWLRVFEGKRIWL